jgi:hypothetical protein
VASLAGVTSETSFLDISGIASIPVLGKSVLTEGSAGTLYRGERWPVQGVLLPGQDRRTAFAVRRSDRAGLTRGGRVAWRVGNTDPLAFPERVFPLWVDWHAGAYTTKTWFCFPG